jgi:PAS domain S-box-containing protein
LPVKPAKLQPYPEFKNTALCSINSENRIMGKLEKEPLALTKKVEELRAQVRDLTRKLASDSNARTIIEASSDILLLLDKEGTVLICNQKLALQFEIKADDLTGKCLFGFMRDELTSKWKKLLAEVFDSGKPAKGEAERNGRTYSYRFFPVKDENGNVQKVAVYAYDSTEQKAARKALIENEEIFSSFIENSPIYVFFKDEQIRPVRLSRNFETMLGFPLYQIIGKTMNDLFPSELAENMVNDDLKVLQEGKQIKVIEEFQGRSYSTIKFPVYIDGIPKYLAGYTIDITEQNQAEKSLRESEERFRKVYAEGTLPIAMLDGNFKFINANQVFQSTFGYSETELKDMTFKEITHPDHLMHDMENLNLLIHGDISVYRTEKRYFTKQGTIVWGNVQVSIVYDTQNKFMYFLVMIDNITKYKLAEAEIRSKNEQLERINAEKDKFFSIIAHDLRSPFNSFLGLTEMMAEDLYTMTLEEIQQIATDMKNSAENLYRLLENLLEWSMIQRGMTPFNPQPLQLSEVIKDNLVTMTEPIRKKSIRVFADIQDDIRFVGDQNMIAAIFRNLLSNAVKFTPKGGSVAIKVEKCNNSIVEISIKDTGIGMEPEMKETLFNLDSHNNRPGTDGELSTGLGLLLCKEFVEKHGGSISVESEPDKGSKFIIEFPQ